MNSRWAGFRRVLGYALGCVGLALVAANSLSAGAATVATLEVGGDAEVARVVFELPLGMFVDAELTGQNSNLELRLKSADRRDLATRLEQLAKKHPLLKGARLLPGRGDEVRVLFEFDRPLVVLDETVVALPNQLSRWEIVLGIDKQAQAPVAASALSQIRAVRRDGRLDITLIGSAGLVAEAFFPEGRPVLAVDLPGVTPEQAKAAAGRFRGDGGMLRSVQALASGTRGSRLLFELAEAADLVDTQGLIADGQGQVVMSLVPDAQAKAAPGGSLAALGFETEDGLMQFRLSGIAGSRVNAYTIEDPPRLVVDFLGWTPEQVKDALARFRANTPATLGEARLDTTRLGSARAVFDLAVSAPFQTARSITVPGASGKPAVETLLISLAPGAVPADTQMFARSGPVDLRLRRELLHGRQPSIVIRAPTLESRSRFAQAAVRPERGKEFELIGMLTKALAADPKYAAAKAEFDAIGEAVPQARAGYLPVASFDYQRSTMRQNVTQASNPTFPTGVSTYPNRSMTLTLTQPVFKPQAWVKMNQAAVAVEQAKLNVIAAEQDLILRVSTAYLNLLAAHDGVELSRAEREATEKQHELASTRLKTGLGTITQFHDTEARLSLTQAREIEARSRLDDAMLAIKEILGVSVSGVRGIKADFDTANPVPATHDPWVSAALEQNLALQSRSMAQQIAMLEITRQRAGHLPTLSLVGTLTNQDSGGSLYGAGQRYENRDLGVRLSIPLTDGGLTSSLVRESRARQEKVANELEQEQRRTERLARSAFNGVIASSRTMTALRQSVFAQESALQARLEGFNSGLYNVVVVMDAYRLYYTAQRDFLQARYDYLVNRLKLKQAVGTLSRADLEDIAVLLK